VIGDVVDEVRKALPARNGIGSQPTARIPRPRDSVGFALPEWNLPLVFCDFTSGTGQMWQIAGPKLTLKDPDSDRSWTAVGSGRSTGAGGVLALYSAASGRLRIAIRDADGTLRMLCETTAETACIHLVAGQFIGSGPTALASLRLGHRTHIDSLRLRLRGDDGAGSSASGGVRLLLARPGPLRGPAPHPFAGLPARRAGRVPHQWQRRCAGRGGSAREHWPQLVKYQRMVLRGFG
jgi:hypothetical protein